MDPAAQGQSPAKPAASVELNPVTGYDEDSVFAASSGSGKVIAAGSIIPLEKTGCKIEIPFAPGIPPLALEMVFERDDEHKEQRVIVESNRDTPLVQRLHLWNIESPAGGGPSGPISLWRSETEEVVVMLRIYTLIGGASPLIHFSFYKKPLT
jgi:hypothetical protein